MFKRRKVIVYGYGKLDRFAKKIFGQATIIHNEENDKKYSMFHVKHRIRKYN